MHVHGRGRKANSHLFQFPKVPTILLYTHTHTHIHTQISTHHYIAYVDPEGILNL